MQPNIIKIALLHAFGTSAYIAGISSLLFYGENFLPFPEEDAVYMPIMMLSLLVFSAALTGSLVFGRPLLWYLDGKKQEAVKLLIYTLGFFAVTTFVVILGLYLVV